MQAISGIGGVLPFFGQVKAASKFRMFNVAENIITLAYHVRSKDTELIRIYPIKINLPALIERKCIEGKVIRYNIIAL